MFESLELVPANLLFEFIANEMQILFDLLHILFQDRNVFFQFADRFKGFVALLANGVKTLAEYCELTAEVFEDDGILVPVFL